MSKQKTYTSIMLVLAIALAAGAGWAWLRTPGGNTPGLARTPYAVHEGKRLVRLTDSQGHSMMVVEDARGQQLFDVPVHDCLLAEGYQGGRLAFKMKATGQTGYIDALGTAYLTGNDAQPQRPDEGKNTAQIEPQEQTSTPNPAPHQQPGTAKPAPATATGLPQANLRQMAKSNPFYDEAAKVIGGHLEVSDSASRHMILDYCEHFRTAYTRRDLPFLRQVFSDRALIIVGSVVSSGQAQDGAQDPRVARYSVRTKEEYLKRLERVFQTNKKISVRFSDFHIMKHPTVDGIYGVRLRQKYQADNYADDGYLFLLWDFTHPQRPLIHVRTWQPAADVSSGDEIIDLSDFTLN